MVARYRFISCHPVTRTLLDPGLNLVNPGWSWAVGGNGTLEGTISVPSNQSAIDRIRQATTRLESAIYVQRRDGSYAWGGPVIYRKWNPGTSQLQIKCMEWRSWLYNIIYMPGASADILFAAVPPSGQEQLALARAVLLGATGGGGSNGCPPYTQDADVSGKLRELTFYASQGKRVGELLESMANRDGGFEWTLQPRPDPSDGLPRLHFLLSFPEYGGLIAGLKFRSTPGGSNFTPQDIEEDGSSSVNQFLANGSGTPPDRLYVVQASSVLPSNGVLRMDASATYNTVVDRNTLSAHARRALRFYGVGIDNMSGTHTFGEIDPDSYSIGDRAQLVIKDRMYDLEYDAVRVVEKGIRISANGAGSVSFRLDLSDNTLPEVDAGGTI